MIYKDNDVPTVTKIWEIRLSCFFICTHTIECRGPFHWNDWSYTTNTRQEKRKSESLGQVKGSISPVENGRVEESHTNEECKHWVILRKQYQTEDRTLRDWRICQKFYTYWWNVWNPIFQDTQKYYVLQYISGTVTVCYTKMVGDLKEVEWEEGGGFKDLWGPEKWRDIGNGKGLVYINTSEKYDWKWTYSRSS